MLWRPRPGYWVGHTFEQGPAKMRNTIMGAGAAAALIAVLFVISRLVPGTAPAPAAAPRANVPSAEQIAQQAAKVTPGFIGQAVIGNWEVACAKAAAATPAGPSPSKVPFTLNASGQPEAAKPLVPTQPELKFGRCRAALLVRSRSNPKSIALIAVFRLVGDSQDVALILRVPPVVKTGAKVLVALAEKQAVGLPVTNCEKGQCMALGILKPNVYAAMASKPRLAVVVPIQANGQRMIIPLSMVGLPESVAALRRAG